MQQPPLICFKGATGAEEEHRVTLLLLAVCMLIRGRKGNGKDQTFLMALARVLVELEIVGSLDFTEF